MKTSKYFLLVAALVLLVGLVGTAMAQGKMDSKGSAFRLPPEPIQPIVSVSAIEVTDGIVGMDSTRERKPLSDTASWVRLQVPCPDHSPCP